MIIRLRSKAPPEPRSRSLGENPAAKYRRHATRRSGITSFTSQSDHLKIIPEDQKTGKDNERILLDDKIEKDELKSEGKEEGEASYEPDEESEHGDSDAVSDMS